MGGRTRTRAPKAPPRLRAALLVAVGIGMVAPSGADTEEADAAPPIYRAGDLRLQDPWAKGAIGVHGVKLFFGFRNLGTPDRLVGVESAVASGETKFYLVIQKDGERALKTLAHIPIPSTETPFELTEVGYYIELQGLEVPLAMGKEFSVTLHFEGAGAIEVPFRSRFHSPSLSRRIRDAVKRGDLEALEALREGKTP